MSPTHPEPAPVVHLARPGRAARVVEDLGELRGPTSGVVELPHRLMWQPNRSFDLGDPDQLTWMYENVLREAIRVDELRTWIDGSTLVRLWHGLNLPRGVRQAWERKHPRLRSAQ